MSWAIGELKILRIIKGGLGLMSSCARLPRLFILISVAETKFAEFWIFIDFKEISEIFRSRSRSTSARLLFFLFFFFSLIYSIRNVFQCTVNSCFNVRQKHVSMYGSFVCQCTLVTLRKMLGCTLKTVWMYVSAADQGAEIAKKPVKMYVKSHSGALPPIKSVSLYDKKLTELWENVSMYDS